MRNRKETPSSSTGSTGDLILSSITTVPSAKCSFQRRWLLLCFAFGGVCLWASPLLYGIGSFTSQQPTVKGKENDWNTNNNATARITTTFTTTSPITGVPPRLIFTHHTNLLPQEVVEEEEGHNNASKRLPQPSRKAHLLRPNRYTSSRQRTSGQEQVLRQNVKNSIDKYKTVFLADNNNNNNNTSYNKTNNFHVTFLTDPDCRKILQTVRPSLVPYFDRESVGKYRADMCRIAELYAHGGYYFDVDLQVIEPFVLSDYETGVEFATVWETSTFGGGSPGFFQAFVASVPRHAILEHALDTMVEFYNKRQKGKGSGKNLGTVTLKLAYDRYLQEEEQNRRNNKTTKDGSRRKNATNILLLHEDKLEGALRQTYSRFVHPQRPSSPNSGWGCNFVVHNGKKPYFFSRVLGAKTTNMDGAGCWRRR